MQLVWYKKVFTKLLCIQWLNIGVRWLDLSRNLPFMSLFTNKHIFMLSFVGYNTGKGQGTEQLYLFVWNWNESRKLKVKRCSYAYQNKCCLCSSRLILVYSKCIISFCMIDNAFSMATIQNRKAIRQFGKAAKRSPPEDLINKAPWEIICDTCCWDRNP